MSNSYKSYSTNLEKKEIKDKHAERRALIEKRENEKRKEWIKEMKYREEDFGV